MSKVAIIMGSDSDLSVMQVAADQLAELGVPMDSLLSIVQMPAGIPVATVAVENARNAALLSARILAVGDPDLRLRLHEYREEMRRTVEQRGGLDQP